MAITTLQSGLFLTPFILCVLILYISGGTYYSLKSIPNNKFEKLLMAILFTPRVFARNLLRGNRGRNIFRISFWCLACDLNPGFSSNKPTLYLPDHGSKSLLKIQRISFNVDVDVITGRAYIGPNSLSKNLIELSFLQSKLPLIRWEAIVQTTAQTFRTKRCMNKYFFSDLFLADFWQKLWRGKIKLLWKVFQKCVVWSRL